MIGEPTYGASFFASLFKISERRVQQLAKEGVIPKIGQNQYPLLGTVKAYVSFLKDSGSGTSSDDYKDGRARKMQAEAQAKEIANDVRAGSLYEKIDSDQKLAEAFKIFQQSVLTLPDVAERDAGLNAEQVDFLINICDGTLEVLAQSLNGLMTDNG